MQESIFHIIQSSVHELLFDYANTFTGNTAIKAHFLSFLVVWIFEDFFSFCFLNRKCMVS